VRCGIAIALACVLPSPAAALNAAAAAAVAAGQPGAREADSRAARAADRLLVASGADAQMDAILPRIIDSIMPLLIRGNSGQEQVIKTILREELMSIFTRLKPDLIANARKVYLDHFSADELEAILSFMESPVGRKLARETPAITTELYSFGGEAGRAAVAGAMPHIIDRMRSANLVVPSGT